MAFYTSGADVTTGALDFPGLVFSGGENTWTTLQNYLVDFINSNDGEASVGKTISARHGFLRAGDSSPIRDDAFWQRVERRTADPEAFEAAAQAARNAVAADSMEIERTNGLIYLLYP